MIITPKKTPVDILDTLQREIFSTPKRPLHELNSPGNSVASSPQTWSPQGSTLCTPEKVVTLSTGLFYKPKREYLNPLERMVIGKPKVYLPLLSKESVKSAKVRPKSLSHATSVSGKSKKKVKRINHKSSKEKQRRNQKEVKKILSSPRPNVEGSLHTPTKQQSSPPKIGSELRTPPKRDSSRNSPSSGTRTSPRRKFFVARPSTSGKKRWQTDAYGKAVFALDFKSGRGSKRSSPLAKRSPSTRISHETTPESNRQPLLNESNDDNVTNLPSRKRKTTKLDPDSSDRSPVNDSTLVKKTKIDARLEKEISGGLVEVANDEPDAEIIQHQSPATYKGDDTTHDSTPKKCYPIFSPTSQNKGSKQSPATPRLPTRSSPRRHKSNRFTKCNGSDQMVIDAGQRNLGAHQCPSCSMVYSRGDPHDELMHSKYHNTFLGVLKFGSWKKERIVGKYIDGKVIMILPTDPAFMLRKVHDVREIVDRELGFSMATTRGNHYSAFLMYVTDGGRIAGFLVAESITQAFQVLPPNVSQSPSKNVRGWYCSTEPQKALCGVNRIWTDANYRRKRIATRLVDCLKCHFIYGQVLKLDEIAFSDPTELGKSFAAKYTGTETFLVYK